ncbi:MAG: hypothetical protein JW787_07220 [Sedimentisphaerales bacterium]|nr:hypothetical protein [Sedimentisphaerales bacterium]
MQNPKLKSEEVISTIEKLLMRITERFPDSGLSKVCEDLLELSKESDRTIQWISKPNYIIRLLVALFLSILAIVLVYSVIHIDFEVGRFGLAEFVQSSEAALNEIVLIGAGVVFLVSFEARRKRKRVITATNKLRCFAHIIDSHQLTKDPDRVSKIYTVTQNSPKQSLDEYELGRYLDYCSEMLALVGKIGFLYVQDFNDPQANNAVNDLEVLTTAMARKIWQKIMILRIDKQ